MAIRNIVKEGDPVLRGKCRPVEEITPRILTLLDDMRETLADADGVGLAATQEGVIERSGHQRDLEGCLSVPGRWGYTNRPMHVTVQAQDRDGKIFTVSGSGLTARAFCHEIDHLDGILFIDHAEECEIDE